MITLWPRGSRRRGSSSPRVGRVWLLGAPPFDRGSAARHGKRLMGGNSNGRHRLIQASGHSYGRAVKSLADSPLPTPSSYAVNGVATPSNPSGRQLATLQSHSAIRSGSLASHTGTCDLEFHGRQPPIHRSPSQRIGNGRKGAHGRLGLTRSYPTGKGSAGGDRAPSGELEQLAAHRGKNPEVAGSNPALAADGGVG